MPHSVVSKRAHQVLERFCASLEEEGYSAATVKNYRVDVEIFLRWLELSSGNPFSKKNLTSLNLESYREFLISRYRAATVNRRLVSGKKFFRWGEQIGLMKQGQVSALRPVIAPLPIARCSKWLEPAELNRVWDAVREAGDKRHIAILSILLTGIRVSELCSLTLESIISASNSGTLSLPVGAYKRVRREIHLTEETRIALKDFLDTEIHLGSGILGENTTRLVSRRQVDHLVHIYAESANLPHLKPFTFRSTYSRNLANTGINAIELAKYLGHSSAQTVLRYYGGGVDYLQMMPDGFRDSFDDAPGLKLLGGTVPNDIDTPRSGVLPNLLVREAVLHRACKRCEKCGTEETFAGFLSVHHVLNTDPEDELSNCVALCPNCNLEAHVSPWRTELNKHMGEIATTKAKRAAQVPQKNRD
jgi:site-specific recombinase XerD